MTSCRIEGFHFQNVNKQCEKWIELSHVNATYMGFVKCLDHF